MAGIKITEYPNTQTSFDDDDEFDVSAYQGPSADYQTRKYTWSTLVNELTSIIGVGLPSGTNGQILAHNASAWVATSNIFVKFTNGNIGIGTTNPGYQLDIVKNDNSFVTHFRLKNGIESTDSACLMEWENGRTGAKVGVIGDIGGYKVGFGDKQSMFIKGNNGVKEINYIARNDVSLGVHNFWASILPVEPDGASATAPSLQIQNDGALMFNKMWDEGYTTGFEVQGISLASPQLQDNELLIWLDGIQYGLFAKQY